MSDVHTEDRRKALDHFAEAPPRNGDGNNLIVPMQSPVDRVFGAQKVAVYRDDARVLSRLKALAAAAGDDWFYRYPVKNRKENRTDWIEGPSIKLANDVARIYGNCDVDTRVMDLGDSWVIYARFTDFETGFSLTRPYQQRKNQRSVGDSADRQLDIAFQIGVSKACRNVVVNALQTYADYAFTEARQSLVTKIEGDIAKWRGRTVEGLGKMSADLDIKRVEKVIGRTAAEWLAPDIARVIAMMKAISDGMATIEESFPPLDAKPVGGDAPAGEQTSSAQAPKASEAGQADPDKTASQTSSQGSSTASAESGSAKVADKTDTKPGADKADEFVPTTEAQYIAYANSWREKLTDAASGMTRWKAEKGLRNKANVGPEARDSLHKQLQDKCALLSEAES